MWIRSQDRKVLINVETLHMAIRSVVADTYGSRIKCHNFLVKCNQITLGAYSTEDKSLKILDMMQEHIEKEGTLIKDKDGFFDTPSIVFQMPQESEVE